ncbi:PASTA domain-containing protein [Cupriavidus oxalaticus]|uniref:PASTA domain-containing protein n=1 Tax=Cupriavidus oxalaticus TaxID=96344 RepID=A0A4V1BZI7_9BURK|nr:PASTA domain-containing protein [Cupriavidus oxalaticus]QBY55462.1 PASTA domain-containing protein [Cupriavidus oxalaticus]
MANEFSFAMSLPINMLIAEREGLPRSDAIRIGALASLTVRSMPISLVVTQLLARRELPQEPAPVPTPQKLLEIPAVPRNKEKNSAVLMLLDAGFTVGTALEKNENCEEGEVIRYEPESGQKVPKGTKVTVILSCAHREQTESPPLGAGSAEPVDFHGPLAADKADKKMT